MCDKHPALGRGPARREEERTGVGAAIAGDRADSPVLHCGEGALVCDVIHQDEAHGPSVVGSGDGPVPLLACCVLKVATKISLK